MKRRKTTIVEVFGGPKRIVEHIVTDPRTTTVCPLCRRQFSVDAPTVLVDLVTQFSVDDHKTERPITSVRVHLCEPCAQPIVAHKQKAVDGFISAVAEMLASSVIKEMEQKGEI